MGVLKNKHLIGLEDTTAEDIQKSKDAVIKQSAKINR